MFAYSSVAKIAQKATEQNTTIGRLVLAHQAEAMEKTPAELMELMDRQLAVMEQSAVHGGRKDIRSTSGLTGGDGWRMGQYAAAGSLSGSFCARAIAVALSVADPTAGSCGILPGAILPMMEQRGVSREDACLALVAAGGIGMVLAQQASISGAEGGCQAECGSAAAMAAAALVELSGGTPEMAANAVAMAIKNQLGLVCDPVAGLVEIPCIKRNVSGIAIAFTSAEMALAGMDSKIPADECIDAMRAVGDSMPCALKETAQGGLAVTPTGLKLKAQVFGE